MRMHPRQPAIRSLPEELPAPLEFRDPPPGYGPVPVWLWNARLDEAEVRRQVRELAEKGCSGAVLRAGAELEGRHSREEWLELVCAALDEAASFSFAIEPPDEVASTLAKQGVVSGSPLHDARTVDAGAGGVALRLAASRAHQEGRTRVASVGFGPAAWSGTLADRKAGADWQLAHGINLFVPQAACYTVSGARKHGSPPSEFEQQMFWPHYRGFADYVARLCFLLTRGRHAARTAVLYPPELGAEAPGRVPGAPSAELLFASYGAPEEILRARVEHDLAALCELLASLHFDFDLLDVEGLAEARILKSRLCRGPERYELLILPSLTTCPGDTWAKVGEFFEGGGNILSCGLLPFRSGEGDAADAELQAAVRALTTVDPTEPERPGGTTARAMGRDAMRPLNVNRKHGSRVARYLPWRVPLPQQRTLLMKTLLRTLVTIDVDVECPDLLCHQRETADGKLFFLVNTASEPRRVSAIFYALGHPEEWDAETGEVRRIWQYARAGERVTMPLSFAPHQARVIAFTGSEDQRVERANFVATSVTDAGDHYLVQGHARDHDRPLDTPPNCSLAWEGSARWAEGIDKGLLEPIRLGDVWDLRVIGDNVLVLPQWRFHTPRPDEDPSALSTFHDYWEALPARPGTPSPLPEPVATAAWFQTRFRLESVPRSLSLLLEPLDAPHTVLVNGHPVIPVQTGVLDPMFLTADIADLVAEGENVVAIALSTGGLAAGPPEERRRSEADRLPQPARLLGDFTALPEEDGEYLLYAGAPEQIATGSWTEQGFPHLSGTLEYSQSVFVAPDYFEFELVLTCEKPADIVEVLVNGRPAGVRRWPPYAVNVSEHLFAGENRITLRVTNAASNALFGEPRPSGLLGPVRIEPYARFDVKVPK